MPRNADTAGVKRILFLTLLATGLALQRQPYRDAYTSLRLEHDLEASSERWDNVEDDSLHHSSLSGQRGYRNTYSGSVSNNERAIATLSPAENSAARVPPAPR